MKKNTALFSLALCVSIFTGCSEESPVLNEASYLSIETTIPTTRGLKTSFVANDEMAIFAKSSASLTGNWYNDATSASKATYNGSSWSLNPNIMLNSNTAYIFAYYPYSSQATDPEAVPVSTVAQLDYLYGGSSNTASSTSNTLALNMAHAQANFRFNVSNQGYSGVGLLKSITIANKSGKKVLFTEGTLNIATGVVTGKTGANSAYAIADINKNIEIGGNWASTLPSAMIIPFNPTAKGDVEFIFNIDDKIYTIECPTQTNGYIRGQQYTFNLKLSGRDLVLNQEDITIEPWGDNSVDLDDVVTRGNSVAYTVTTSSPNQSIALPALNAAKGEVSFGDGQTGTYSTNLQHTYEAAGTYQVVINTESALTQATFKEMGSVTEIDFSGMGGE